MHSVNLKRQRISKDLLDQTLSPNLYDISFSETNGKIKLRASFKEELTDEVKIVTFNDTGSAY